MGNERGISAGNKRLIIERHTAALYRWRTSSEGGGGRQIPIEPSRPRQTWNGQAKLDADGAIPD
ncbi:uncharacterized protein AFUA_3G13500 [Aspergillus fumigatus Af293]|uniref:Uncharacterized protein n=1 Tax=Aspergillus fumigatus (strain ATCC MYA-4609 / CBS 101355 / FGSC A1100 / Af293) TaxID=330879 RepID=Q4WYL9_ASPFU|nr:hypothetical protein AFUA_3G13500 [Aspergillus fumigatus Af293]EAL92234.2 hypothetical protein AFUA_3G13500 [Aspergillus fumigatus Af293]